MGRRPEGCRLGGVSALPSPLATSGHPGHLLPEGLEMSECPPPLLGRKLSIPRLLKAGDGIGMVLLGYGGFHALHPLSYLPPTSHKEELGARLLCPPAPPGDSPGPLTLPHFSLPVGPRPLAFLSQACYVYLIIELLKYLVSLGP